MAHNNFQIWNVVEWSEVVSIFCLSYLFLPKSCENDFDDDDEHLQKKIYEKLNN